MGVNVYIFSESSLQHLCINSCLLAGAVRVIKYSAPELTAFKHCLMSLKMNVFSYLYVRGGGGEGS